MRGLTVEDEMEILQRRERAKEQYEARKSLAAMIGTLTLAAALLITLRFYPEVFSQLARALIDQVVPHPHHLSAAP